MNKNEFVCYSKDASGLEGNVEKAVSPRKDEEIQEIIRLAKSDVIPRGSGSNIVGACRPNNSIVIDMRKFNKVSEFDPQKKTVIVEGGVTIKELNEKLKSINYEFPIEYSSLSTIGGMIAMNKIGMKSMKYGSIRDWIEEIEFINGRGEIVTLGKTDLLDVCGMEGTTGVILRAKLKIIPLTENSFSVFQSEDIEETLAITKRLKLDKDVIILKFYNKEASSLLGFPKKNHLIVGFDSDRGKIKGKESKELLNKIENEIYYFISNEYREIQDTSLSFEKLCQFIYYLEDNDIPFTSDLGYGIINPLFKQDQSNVIEKTKFLIKRLGGKRGKYGIGVKNKPILDSLEIKILQRIKLRHDPFNRLNKEKLISFQIFENKEKNTALLAENSLLNKHYLEVPLEKEEKKSISVFIPTEAKQTLSKPKNTFLADSIIKTEKFPVLQEKPGVYEEKSEKTEYFPENFPKTPYTKALNQNTDDKHSLKEDARPINRLSDESEKNQKGKISDEEKSLIDRIMTNKYKKQD